jgi:DNA mismatch repair protein MSH6
LEDKSQDFKSKTLSQLLRGAPDLLQHIKNLREQFEEPSKDSKEKGESSVKSGVNSPNRGYPDDLLLPQDGKDEAYDNVEAEIATLKDKLDAALKKLAAKSGFVTESPLLIEID